MQVPVDFTTRDITLTDRHETMIRDRVARLEKFWPRITGARVVIEGPPKQRTGGPYKVRVDLSVPGSELVVDRQVGESLEAAINSAFKAVRRKLKSYAQMRRGEVKRHEPASPEAPLPTTD